MEGGSVLGTLLAGAILLLMGSLIAFGGFRLFLICCRSTVLLRLSFGAHSVQALFGDGFLSTTTSWVVGFFAGLFVRSPLVPVLGLRDRPGSRLARVRLGSGLLRTVRRRSRRVGLDRRRRGRHRLRDRRDGDEPPEGHRDHLHGLPGRLDDRGDVPIPVHFRHAPEHRGERREAGAGRPPAVVPHLRRRRRGGHALPVPGQPCYEIERYNRWEMYTAEVRGAPPPAGM